MRDARRFADEGGGIGVERLGMMVTNTGCGWMMWRGRVYVVRGLTDGLFRDL